MTAQAAEELAAQIEQQKLEEQKTEVRFRSENHCIRNSFHEHNSNRHPRRPQRRIWWNKVRRHYTPSTSASPPPEVARAALGTAVAGAFLHSGFPKIHHPWWSAWRRTTTVVSKAQGAGYGLIRCLHSWIGCPLRLGGWISADPRGGRDPPFAQAQLGDADS